MREPEMAEVIPRRIGIVGLGLIGGSLACRLCDAGCEVLAWNHTTRPYASAETYGIHCMPTLKALAIAQPDVLILCNPLRAMPEILEALRPVLNPVTTLTDVGSVKGMVRDQVISAGLERYYVGAHPMAGNERSGWEAADAALYDGALWAVTVDANTEYQRFMTVASMVTELCRNRLMVLDDVSHDRAAALISHMPHVVATALINELVANPGRDVAASLAAGSWRDMTRVALTDPNRTRAMVEEDSANVSSLLRSMAVRLTTMADALDDGQETAVADFFAEGQPFRDYKAGRNIARDDGAEHTVQVPEQGWQDMLRDLAYAGDHVIRCNGYRSMVVRRVVHVV